MNPPAGRRAAVQSILVVGNPLPFHIGHHLLDAARNLGLPAQLLDVRQAAGRSRLLQSLCWRLGRRAPHQRWFGRRLLELCETTRPDLVLVTGMVPLARPALDAVQRTGIRCANFLTDDPWNPAHRSAWFLAALPAYDQLFSPRTANLHDLSQAGCPAVHYLPFAYNPRVHYPEQPDAAADDHLASDVLFAGGADADRIAWIDALLAARLDVALYGGYWDRYPATRACGRGIAGPDVLRRAVARARLCLCLVRRSNRDGHVMRTFEVPAMGGCMLAERTDEHRAILGEEGDAVRYFGSPGELVEQARWLLDRPDERARLAQRAHQRITQAPNTYADRLRQMLAWVERP